MNKQKIHSRILFSFLVLVSFALRIYRLNQGLWYDEILTLEKFLRLPWNEIIISLPLPNNHILYSLLARLCIVVFGEKEWSVRLPSFMIGGFTPAIAYLVLRKRFSEFSAFFSGLFLALNFWMVWFSQDARGYSGMVLFTLLSQIFFLKWMEQRKARTAMYYLVCSVFACWFHLYSVFVILAQAAFGFFKWLWQRRAQSALIFLLPMLSLFFASLLYVPGALDLFSYIGKEGRDLGGRWLDLNFLQEVFKLCAGSHLLWTALVCFSLAVLGFSRIYKDASEIFWIYLLSVVLLIVFTATLRVFIYARFLAFLIPVFALALALGIEGFSHALFSANIRLKRLAIGFLLIAVSLSLLISLNRYYRLGKQGLKDAAMYIQANYPLARVISLGLARNEFLHYYPRAQPVYGQVQLDPSDISGKLVVASHPWSWAPWNQGMLERFCKKEMVWESAGYDENVVYLYNCLKSGVDFGAK